MGFTTEFGPQWTYKPPAAATHVVDAARLPWRCTCSHVFTTHYRDLPTAVADHGGHLIRMPASWATNETPLQST